MANHWKNKKYINIYVKIYKKYKYISKNNKKNQNFSFKLSN